MLLSAGARRRRWGRVMGLVAATSALPLSGCSFLFLDRPSQYKSGEKTTCTTTYELPAIDTGFALLHIVSIAVLASASGDAYGGEKNRSSLAQVDLTWLIVQGGSAIFGFSWVGECKDLVGDVGFGTRPVRPAPRPRPRPIAPATDASSPQPAQPTPPVPPAPAAPAAAPEEPAPQAPRVPQRIDNE
jgi:hypothetical protein